MLKEIKAAADPNELGMILVHNGIVRGTSKNGQSITKMRLSFDQQKLLSTVEEFKNKENIVDIKAWINHILVSDGRFHANGIFSVSPAIDTKALEQIFRHKVLKMLLAKGKITQDMISLLDKWRHTGFNVFCGPRILPWHRRSMENLARYIVRASFSQERMLYLREAAQVEYQSKDGKETKVFDALEWLAAMCSHVPGKGEQMVRYYGYYSNVARGKRKKADADDNIPCILTQGVGTHPKVAHNIKFSLISPKYPLKSHIFPTDI